MRVVWVMEYFEDLGQDTEFLWDHEVQTLLKQGVLQYASKNDMVVLAPISLHAVSVT